MNDLPQRYAALVAKHLRLLEALRGAVGIRKWGTVPLYTITEHPNIPTSLPDIHAPTLLEALFAYHETHP